MADKENIYGIKYEVNIDELKTSTSEAGRQIKLANAEFNRSKSLLENWGTSTEGVGAKIKQLNAVLEAEKSKLANLKNAYNTNVDEVNKYGQEIADLQTQKEEAIAQYGKESEEVKKLESQITKLERKQDASRATAEKLNISIIEQETKVNSTAKEIDKFNGRLSELQTEQSKTASATEKLKSSISEQEAELQDLKEEYTNVVLEQGKTSDEAKQLASKMRELNGDLAKSKSELSKVEQEADGLTDSLDDAGNEAEDTGGGFTILKGALADMVAGGMEAAISKAGELVGQLFELSEATEEYRTMNAKLEGSANTFGYSVEFAKDKYKELYSYLKDDQMATNAITNLMGLGASTDTVSSIVNSAIGVWSAYGDSIPIEGLTESINETAQVGKVTGSLADALNWAGISEDDFNAKLEATNGTKERAQLIADTLNGKYGESKKTYDELTGSMTEANRAEAELKETQAELGETMDPVNTAITNLKTKALDKIAPAVETVAGKFLDFTNYLSEHPAVANVVIAVIIALAAAFGTLAGALAIQGLIVGVQKAFALLNATLLANPITWVVTAIVALAAGFIYLWNTSEGFRNFWIGLWENIKTIVGIAVDGLVIFFTVTIPTAWETLKQKCSEVVTAVSQFFTNLWLGIVDFFTQTIPGWIENVINFFQQIPNYIGYMVGFIIGKFILWGQKLVSFVTVDIPQFITKTVSFFSQLPGKIWAFLLDVINKTAQWVSDMINKAIQAGSSFLNNVANFFSQLPGRVWGFLSNVISNTAQWVSDMIGKAGEAGSSFLSNVANFFSQLPGRVWEFLSSTLSNAASFASDLGAKATEAGQNLLNNIVNTVQGLPGEMLAIGQNVVQGLWDGISGMIDWVVGMVQGFGSSVIDGIKDALGIHSPSKEAYYLGEMFDLGFGNAIADGTKKVVDKAKKMSGNVMATMKDKLKEKVTVGYEVVGNLKKGAREAINTLTMNAGSDRLAYAGAAQSTNNISFTQNNYSPKALDSLEVYRNTRKQLKQLKKWKGK